MKKVYVLTLTGASRISLALPDQPPFWTLDFSGTLTCVGAFKEAKNLLLRLGEHVPEDGIELMTTSDKRAPMTLTYLVTTVPVEMMTKAVV
ncbi:MAG TPA: hypothetical protein VMJ72_01100 [Candidatus Paceibacterota bacterium]|nr:hypothetical protein [Candidatus Paceibacterota bacterium]